MMRVMLGSVPKLVATLARAWGLRRLLQKTHALGERGYVRGGVLGQSLVATKCANSPTLERDSMSDDTPQSLYERLGGFYNIAAVVDDFIDRIMDNAELNANPKVDEAHHRVSRAGFKYIVTEMVCWASGGPQTYSGKTMRESHEHLDITEQEWHVFLKDFQDSLDKFDVPPAEQKELFAIVESTKGDIVVLGS